MPPKNKNPRERTLDAKMNSVQRAMDKMYQTTFYNTSTSSKQLDTLTKSINDNIDRITNYNQNTMGMPSISKLYSRMNISTSTGAKDVTQLFDNALGFDDFYSNFMQNRYLVEVDAEIDAVCKYFPELLEALDIKKEGVLSADHFSKDYLNVQLDEKTDEEQFSQRIKDLKETYNLLTLVDEIYDNTAKYGEQFLYVVPYSTALGRLLTDKPNTLGPIHTGVHEGYLNSESYSEEFIFNIDSDNRSKIISKNRRRSGEYICENASYQKPTKYNSAGNPIEFENTPILKNTESFHLEIELNRSGIIDSAVLDAYTVANRKKVLSESVSSEFDRSVLNERKDLKIVKKGASGKLEIEKTIDEKLGISNDGLVTDGIFDVGRTVNKNEIKIDVPGCVVTKVKREQVIPIYVGTTDTCLGYYYIELRSVEAMQDFQGYNYMMSDSLTSLRGSNSGMNAPFNVVDPTRQEELLQYLAGQLSQFIDKEFVQANQDLRAEIYMILKQNDLFNTPSIDKIKVSFIPPEDMIHFYFKLDPNTHRGISDLEKAMVPAKIYASLYITDAIAQLCRGQDKRVFYVRQNVDTNIAQTLLNTIQQIKQGNFGLRQFSSINNVLNITGSFNDFIIPTSANGDSPIQMEVLPGQQFTDNTERMNALKEMAINTTDVPFEMIQTRNSVDYAMQLSMSSSKFLRKIYHRQTLFTPFLSRLLTKLYNFEYKEQKKLTVTLPPPMFLNIANTNQLVDNTKNFIQSVTEWETNGNPDLEDDKTKSIYMNELLKFYLGSHIELAYHEKVLRQAIAKAKKEAKADNDNNGY